MMRWRAGEYVTCRNMTLAAAVLTSTLAIKIFTTLRHNIHMPSVGGEHLLHKAAWELTRIEANAAVYDPNSSIAIFLDITF